MVHYYLDGIQAPENLTSEDDMILKWLKRKPPTLNCQRLLSVILSTVVASIEQSMNETGIPNSLQGDAMKDVVNIIVTCTKDKRQRVSDECQLRNVPGVSILE